MSAPLRAEAHAGLAVVPGDFPSIQAALRAVQGLPDARVRIDSNDTFDETLTVTDSVEIAAGPGFQPTLRGSLAANAGALPGRCVIDFRPASPLGAVLDLIGLTLVPALGSGRGDRVVQLWNQGSGVAQLNLSHVQINNCGSGADGIVARQLTGKGSLVVSLADSLLYLGGEAPANALSFRGAGTVTLERSKVIMRAVANRALVVSGPNASSTRLFVRDSTFDLEVRRAKLASTHLLLENVAVQVEGNHFVSRSVPEGLIVGLSLFGAASIACPVDLHRNDFRHQGEGRSTAVRAVPQPFRILALRATHNIVTGQSEGFHFRPAPRGYASALLLNNTIDTSLGDAVFAQTLESGAVSLRLSHNLITRSAGYAVRLDRQGGSLSFNAESNSYFGNEQGDLHSSEITGSHGENSRPLNQGL